MAAKKPAWPYPEIVTMSAHPCGQWTKKIRGRVRYFGPWSRPAEALERWRCEGAEWEAGRIPQRATTSPTVVAACDAFITAKAAACERGDITRRTLAGYKEAAALAATNLGADRLISDLKPGDFTSLYDQLAKSMGHERLGKTVNYIRMVFRWAYEEELIDKPVRFGSTFKRRKGQRSERMFAADQCRAMLDVANPRVKAMILLGLNGGFGNSDCATLPRSAVDLDDGMIDHPRPKTGEPRVVPLWTDTAQSLRAILADDTRRLRATRGNADLVFLTERGQPWVRHGCDAVTAEFAKVMDKAGVPRGNGSSFYTLRRTFRTVADEAGDQHAAYRIMGHALPGMAGVYVQRISRERLEAVVNHVRQWLFAGACRPRSESSGAGGVMGFGAARTARH